MSGTPGPVEGAVDQAPGFVVGTALRAGCPPVADEERLAGAAVIVEGEAPVTGHGEVGQVGRAHHPGAAVVEGDAEGLRFSVGASADPVRGLDDYDGPALGDQGVSGGKPGGARADDDDVGIGGKRPGPGGQG